MRAVVQRVLSASVTSDGWSASIERGLLVFVGVERGDGPADVDYVSRKIRELRVLADLANPGKGFDRSVQEIGGQVLVVSQFTLAAD